MKTVHFEERKSLIFLEMFKKKTFSDLNPVFQIVGRLWWYKLYLVMVVCKHLSQFNRLL